MEAAGEKAENAIQSGQAGRSFQNGRRSERDRCHEELQRTETAESSIAVRELLGEGSRLATAEGKVTVSRQTVILCIDDNTASLNIRRMLFETKGFVVRTATDGLSGLELADRGPIDAVILDYKMPGMDGEEVAKRLRARHPHIPILLLTGFPGLVPESLLSIVDSFVEKGRPATLLIAEVERLTKASGNPGTDERRWA